MVAIIDKRTGKVIGHEPPYTKEEETALENAMGGGKDQTEMSIFISPQTREHFRAKQRQWLAEHYQAPKPRADD